MTRAQRKRIARINARSYVVIAYNTRPTAPRVVSRARMATTTRRED